MERAIEPRAAGSAIQGTKAECFTIVCTGHQVVTTSETPPSVAPGKEHYLKDGATGPRRKNPLHPLLCGPFPSPFFAMPWLARARDHSPCDCSLWGLAEPP